MSINRLTLTFAVALVILVDLATGQGPPIYTNYLQAQQGYQQPQPQPQLQAPLPHQAVQLQPVGYVHRAEYEPKKVDKEYEKAIELGKASDELSGKHHKLAKKPGDKFDEKFGDKAAGEYEYEGKSTPAPGVLSSISNSMSGAWSRISSLGRSKRDTDDSPKDAPTTTTVAEGAAPNATVGQGAPSGESNTAAEAAKSQGRGIDSYELLHQKPNSYIYFKVPRHLVCNY